MMKTTALRIYGKDDLRLETFELPAIKDDELLVKIVSDSLCMSSYKAAKQGPEHKRVPDDVAKNPTILGHEFCGEIVEVGAKVKGWYKPGLKFVIQPALSGTYNATGYSFQNLGGDATYGVIPAIYLEQDNVLPYEGEAFFYGSLAEPLSCVTGATHANYHTELGSYIHKMETVENGKMAALASVGPMGLALLDYVIHRKRHPKLLVVTDIDEARLARAAEILTVEDAAKNGVELVYLNTGKIDDPVAKMMEISGGTGYDDVFVFAPVAPVVEQGDAILGYDGCLNFFAGPSNTEFAAKFNFYDVHYNATHIVGTSGGNTEDMKESLEMASKGLTNPAILVTHIGGLNAAKDATLNLPDIPGGKKLIYTHIDLPLTAIAEFAELGKSNPLFAELAGLCVDGLWSVEAEKYLLANAPALKAD
ncbi:zinc-binding dehydrogenase [Ruminococcaceae bacterium OttesenSCG-928-D13]|nr:zinc-binding dehydrogenase [Ruminococcaceae bacterium OttesenSCG-928-D13]